MKLLDGISPLANNRRTLDVLRPLIVLDTYCKQVRRDGWYPLLLPGSFLSLDERFFPRIRLHD